VDFRREIEIVDRCEEQARLASNLRRALTIAAVRGAEILTLDDLGETHDRVERRLDLMDEFTDRVGIR